MTGWSDVITAAMTIIDDARWRDDLATSPAIFYRAKAAEQLARALKPDAQLLFPAEKSRVAEALVLRCGFPGA